MARRGEDILVKAQGIDQTPANAVPSAGTATYNGVAGFGASEYSDIEVMSEASLTADFSASTISGRLTNFRDYENTALPGTVNLQGGQINGNTFSANLTGQLSAYGENAVVNGGMLGAFGGSNADMVLAEIEGTIGGQYVVGILGAER